MPHGNPSAAPRVVLSGGIGAGKSSAADVLRRRGWIVVSADEAGHAVLEPGGEAYEAVAARWPEVVVDGRIDRGALARIVFPDPEALAELEAITHPAIARRIAAAVAAAGDRPVVVELPVLAPGMTDPSWTKVYVDAPEAVRLARAVARGGEAADVRRRMAAQPTREEWLDWADVVVENTGDLADLERELVDALAARGVFLSPPPGTLPG